MKVESKREVAQSCPTLSDPMDWSLPGSSVHGNFQAPTPARVPEIKNNPEAPRLQVFQKENDLTLMRESSGIYLA